VIRPQDVPSNSRLHLAIVIRLISTGVRKFTATPVKRSSSPRHRSLSPLRLISIGPLEPSDGPSAVRTSGLCSHCARTVSHEAALGPLGL